MKYIKTKHLTFQYLDGYIRLMTRDEPLDKIAQSYATFGNKKIVDGDLWVRDTEVFALWQNLTYEIIGD